jgi:SAM-dependent methyltransferase
MLQPYLPKDGVLIDIGASAGHFLNAAKPHVGECIAVEPNLANAQFIRDELGFRAYTTPIEQTDLPKGSADLITCFQTMEHIPDPRQFLLNVAEYLAPGGRLYVEVPNVDDALLSVHRVSEYADFWYREPHIYNFSPATLTELTRQAGLEGEILPVQRYGLMNHMSWVLRREPQPSAEVAMGAPRLVPEPQGEVDDEVNAFFADADRAYRDLLCRTMTSESIGFIGQRAG